MVNATAFPAAWGFDQLIGNNQTNIMNASLTVWRESASNNLALTFTFGLIPILLIAVAYIRFKRIDVSILIGIFSTLGLRAFNLMTPYTAYFLWLVMAIGLGISIAAKYNNKT